MEKSPYASRMVELYFGVNKNGPLRVPSDLLKPCRALYNKMEHGRREFDKLHLEKIDIRVEHVLVDFLHRRCCDIADEGSESEIATGFEVALGAYKAAREYELPKLERMAIEKAHKLGNHLPLRIIIQVILGNYEEAAASHEASVYLARRVRYTVQRLETTGVEEALEDIGSGEDPVSTVLRQIMNLHPVPTSQGVGIEEPRTPSVTSEFDTLESSTEKLTPTPSLQSEAYCDRQLEHLASGSGLASCRACSDLVKTLAKNLETVDAHEQEIHKR